MEIYSTNEGRIDMRRFYSGYHFCHLEPKYKIGDYVMVKQRAELQHPPRIVAGQVVGYACRLLFDDITRHIVWQLKYRVDGIADRSLPQMISRLDEGAIFEHEEILTDWTNIDIMVDSELVEQAILLNNVNNLEKGKAVALKGKAEDSIEAENHCDCLDRDIKKINLKLEAISKSLAEKAAIKSKEEEGVQPPKEEEWLPPEAEIDKL